MIQQEQIQILGINKTTINRCSQSDNADGKKDLESFRVLEVLAKILESQVFLKQIKNFKTFTTL